MECPQPQQCSNKTLTATCQVSSNVIVWSRNGQSIKVYTISSSIGETHITGDIKTTLVSKSPTISTLTVSISDTTLQGLTITCADGLSSESSSCTIQIIGE